MGKNNTSFQPGKSGNPKGRPKGSGGLSIATELANELVKTNNAIGPDGNKITNIQAVSMVIVREAVNGKSWAAELLLKYIDGLPVSRHEISGFEGKPIKIVFGDQDAKL